MKIEFESQEELEKVMENIMKQKFKTDNIIVYIDE